MPVRSEVRVILEILGRLAREINATVYLFGSYARGDHTLESDVDIVVVCECFKDMNYPDRVAFVRTKLPLDIGFDIVALTPEEFKSRCNKAFFKDISKYWIEIKP
ncbi:MAG: nucleotidyltransferase domain-containing protein [Candidatus Bathyarchaeia archaeon]